MKKRLAAVAAACAMLMLTVTPAQAITYGRRDGNRHPNVGALVAEYVEPGQKDLLCSGTLISKRDFVTASHCTVFLPSVGVDPDEVWITFDPTFDENSPLIPATYHTNPRYGHDSADLADVAVVVTDRPVSGRTPARLPRLHLLDRLAADNGLHGQDFTAVGYGVQERQVGGGRPSFPDAMERFFAVSEFRALTKTWLRLSQNPATGEGGTCYGDSGGPNFLGAGADETDIVVAVTVTGDAVCRATNTDYRLDTPSARSFLGRFVELP